MSRRLKALLLMELVFRDPASKAMIRAELRRDDPIIDTRFELAVRMGDMIG